MQELSDPVLEVKIKNGRLGSKKYFEIPNLKNKINSLKVGEIQKLALSQNQKNKLFLDKDLNATLIVSYSRKYFENNNNIRVTIDNNIIFSDPSSGKLIKNHDQLLFNKRIIEFKFGVNKKDFVSRFIKT